jgi:hypothetical protein
MDEQDNQLAPFAKSIEEEQAAQKALLSRYEQLQNTLQQRTNLPFDPTLMKISQALLSPTKSGSFGESLGMGVQALVEGSEQEQVRQQNMLKMQAELEEKVLGIKQKGSQLQAISQLAGYGGAPAGAAGAAPAGAPAGAAPAGAGTPAVAAQPFESAIQKYGIQLTEGDPDYLKNDQQLVRELWTSGVRDPQKMREEIRKFKKDRYDIKDGKIFDRGTGKGMAISTGEPISARIYNPDGSIMGVFEKLDSGKVNFLNSLPIGSPQYNALAAELLGMSNPNAPEAPAKPATPPSEEAEAPSPTQAPEATSQTTTGITPRALPKTASQQAVSDEAAKAEAKKIGEGFGEAANQAFKAASSSGTLLVNGENVVRLVDKYPEAFKIMSRPGLGGAIMRAIDRGVSASVGDKNVSFNLPAKEIGQAKLTAGELNAVTLVSNSIANMLHANRQIERIPGEGATSDTETKQLNAMISVDNASPEAIKMISTAVMMRARFAEQVNKVLSDAREKGISTDRAMQSKEMQDVQSGYRNAISSLYSYNINLLDQSKTQKIESSPSFLSVDSVKAEIARRKGIK